MMGLWITFEGIGGSGKSTQADFLYEYFKKQSMNVVLTKEPGGTVIGGLLRNILVINLDVKPESLSELFLFEADRHETFKKIVEPNIKEGIITISDRGIDGSIAYQGFGRGLDINMISTLTNLATDNKKPDITILIDIEPEIAEKRIALRDNKTMDKFDLEKVDFQSRVRDGFLYTAEKDPNRVKIVDGTKDVQSLHKDIIQIIDSQIK
ncbi:dTMP kinase [Radiobacillus kanasensis]|uniref:dTMP kinase n=1 Tax=Radiobacillus kanasensis TaxID=2844358 RepID=UPI001E32F17E|nr:dTMP kinase [Radiobacillus kanasensis]UFT99375.1 dTMP kinase [Radiobacillus kanasensis]